MNTPPDDEKLLTDKRLSIDEPTRAMVRARARELALIAGRPPLRATQADYENAKKELTGESDMDRQDALLDAIPESKRWDPLPGSEGRQSPESASDDENEEGQSQTEQLVDDGVEKAERDHKLQAEREAVKREATKAEILASLYARLNLRSISGASRKKF